jgi:hypothetical protein
MPKDLQLPITILGITQTLKTGEEVLSALYVPLQSTYYDFDYE